MLRGFRFVPGFGLFLRHLRVQNQRRTSTWACSPHQAYPPNSVRDGASNSMKPTPRPAGYLYIYLGVYVSFKEFYIVLKNGLKIKFLTLGTLSNCLKLLKDKMF